MSDSKLTEECGAVYFVENEHEIMILDTRILCWRSITLNKPKQKENDPFVERDVARSVNIAATRIHVERFTKGK